MIFKTVIRAAVAAFFVATSASAASLTGSTQGFHYFWKPGQTIEAHDEAIVDCAVRLRAMVNGSDASSGIVSSGAAAGGLAGGLIGGIVGGVIDGNENRQGEAANMENCMALKGWSVVVMPAVEGKAFEAIDDAKALSAMLVPLLAATPIPAWVARGPFANELATGAFTVGPAGDLDKVSLSVRSTRPAAKAAVAAAGDLKPPKVRPPKGVKAPKRRSGLKAAAFADANPAAAYVALRMTGDKGRVNATTLVFSRLAADGSEVVYDGVATTAAFGNLAGSRLAKGEIAGETFGDFVVALPAGRWKMATISVVPYDADLCFGAPSFELKAGETIYLGEMSVPVDGGYPLTGSNLEMARAILGANPAIAERVKAPEWTNGFTSDCFGSYAYAYEAPGAPFVDMDALKRAASAAPVSAPSEDGASQ